MVGGVGHQFGLVGGGGAALPGRAQAGGAAVVQRQQHPRLRRRKEWVGRAVREVRRLQGRGIDHRVAEGHALAIGHDGHVLRPEGLRRDAGGVVLEGEDHGRAGVRRAAGAQAHVVRPRGDGLHLRHRGHAGAVAVLQVGVGRRSRRGRRSRFLASRLRNIGAVFWGRLDRDRRGGLEGGVRAGGGQHFLPPPPLPLPLLLPFISGSCLIDRIHRGGRALRRRRRLGRSGVLLILLIERVQQALRLGQLLRRERARLGQRLQLGQAHHGVGGDRLGLRLRRRGLRGGLRRLLGCGGSGSRECDRRPDRPAGSPAAIVQRAANGAARRSQRPLQHCRAHDPPHGWRLKTRTVRGHVARVLLLTALSGLEGNLLGHACSRRAQRSADTGARGGLRCRLTTQRLGGRALEACSPTCCAQRRAGADQARVLGVALSLVGQRRGIGVRHARLFGALLDRVIDGRLDHAGTLRGADRTHGGHPGAPGGLTQARNQGGGNGRHAGGQRTNGQASGRHAGRTQGSHGLVADALVFGFAHDLRNASIFGGGAVALQALDGLVGAAKRPGHHVVGAGCVSDELDALDATADDFEAQVGNASDGASLR